MNILKLSYLVLFILLVFSIDLSHGKDATREKNLILFSKNYPEQCQKKSEDFDQTLKCTQKYFIINGHPINPMIIKDLSTWISDGGDQVVAINLLDSQESNKYFSPHDEVQKHGDYFSVEMTPVSKDDHSFSYVIEGVTDNGVFVLQTMEWGGGGTGVFPNLLFVRIREGKGFGEGKDGHFVLNHKRLLIEKLGELPLGDRVKTVVTVHGNTVLLNAEQGLPPYEKSTKKIIISLDDK